MSNPFNDVPYDVLHKYIAPFLDLYSIINFNCVVAKRDKVSRRYKKEDIIEHHIIVASSKLKSAITRLNLLMEKGENVKKIILTFYQFLKMHQDPMIITFLIQYNVKFRNAVYIKFKEFEDPNSRQYQNIKLSPTWKASFIKLAIKGLLFIENHPFIYPMGANIKEPEDI